MMKAVYIDQVTGKFKLSVTSLFLYILLFSISSCNLTGNKTNDIYLDYPLTQNELNFIPYNLNDTIKFITATGTHYKFKCIYKDIITHTTYNKDNPNMVDRNFSCVLKDLNSRDSIVVSVYKMTSTSFDISYYYFIPSAITPYYVGTALDADSLKKSYSLATYLDSAQINGQKYYKVLKMVRNYNTRPSDTTYYSPNNGILQFYFSELDETWMKE